MPADDEAHLEEKLKITHLWLLEAALLKSASQAEKEKSARARSSSLGRSVKRRDLIEFCTLMAFQSKVGVPLLQALEVCGQDCENPGMREVLLGLHHHLEGGLLFHAALEKYPKVFTPHFVSVIRAGETSSKLPESFTDMQHYMEWLDRISAEVRQASIYPGIVLSVVGCFVVGLFTFVVPRFQALLSSVNVPLPLLTQIVFGISDFFRATWWLWLLTIPSVIISVLVAKHYSTRVAFWYDSVKLKLPLLGEINRMLAITRFTHNLSILYRAGIPVLQAINLCRGLTGNMVVEQAVEASEKAIKEGSTVSEAIRRHPIFPPLLLRMVVMGETTGNLDRALDNVSDYYNDVVPRKIKKLLTAFEPALTIFMIFTVGLVALSIYLPILALMGSIHG